MPGNSYKSLRRQLDELGYYQPLVPESVALVDALLHDLLATTHNLKICQESKNPPPLKSQKSEATDSILKSREIQSEKVIQLEKKVSDFQLLYHESLEIIKNLQCEIEERNKKILKLELSQKAEILTTQKPRMEVTSLISSNSSSISSPGEYLSQDQINVIGIYAAKNKSLQTEVQNLGKELDKAKEMLKNVEKYWSQQSLNNKENVQIENPEKSNYALKLVRENKELKEKLESLEKKSPTCFHGKNLPPNSVPSCHNDSIRASVEQSHCNFVSQQSHNLTKVALSSARVRKHPSTASHGPSYVEKAAQKTHHQINQQHSVSNHFLFREILVKNGSKMGKILV